MKSELIILLQSVQPERPLLFVADGDKYWRASVAKAGQALGYGVEEFTRLRDLETRIEETLPHVLVMDGILPDGNGIKFLESLLPRIDGAPLKILFASAVFKKFEHFSRLRAMGVERILSRPCSEEALRAELSRVFPEFGDEADPDFEPAEISGSFPSDWRVA